MQLSLGGSSKVFNKAFEEASFISCAFETTQTLPLPKILPSTIHSHKRRILSTLILLLPLTGVTLSSKRGVPISERRSLKLCDKSAPLSTCSVVADNTLKKSG